MQTIPAHPKLTSGYTFIEILVALTIVSLIFGIGYVSFRDFSRRQALQGVVRSIRGDLRLAQEEAISGQKPLDIFCNSPNTLSGYYFDLITPNNYRLVAQCSGGNVTSKDVTVAADISIAVSQDPIVFKVLGQGTNVPQATPAVITLTQAGTANTAIITITSTGEIK
ncbi:MAG: hypothetical protein UY55_C0007G0003 [Candidatus Jorgensenbacteria bacterium GW2011_GWB1_50_10]|uniref:General secretion pathway GspH domain-containing protein n=1 Tax=Candidatus Jorgensenbacteria bacterium GW2011_GWB1_50_10 TaxID=1618665 RepID=A0A0G1YHR6_9BACT|nr:MAG: hypothetical protein UY55_C0007G0003 [Candidatus Jorgensenbacteria bacterium GW2011_GWB1_50_10]